jgi:copper oxidase (laccase) domain-containing protein
VADLEVTFTRLDLPGLAARFTDRHGGVSVPPYDDANLALHVGDDPDAVTANRRSLRERVGAPIVWMEQVHGADAGLVEGPTDDVVAGVDALVTATAGVALASIIRDLVRVRLLMAAAAGGC